MNTLSISDFKKDNLNIQVKDKENNEIELIIEGAIDVINPAKVLNPYFKELHDKMIKKNIKHIFINLVYLDFINSMGMKTFISWISILKKTEESDKYKLTFLCNKNAKWQLNGFSVMKILLPNFINIKEI